MFKTETRDILSVATIYCGPHLSVTASRKYRLLLRRHSMIHLIVMTMIKCGSKKAWQSWLSMALVYRTTSDHVESELSTRNDRIGPLEIHSHLKKCPHFDHINTQSPSDLTDPREGQFWGQVLSLSPMRSDAVISHTAGIGDPRAAKSCTATTFCRNKRHSSVQLLAGIRRCPQFAFWQMNGIVGDISFIYHKTGPGDCNVVI